MSCHLHGAVGLSQPSVLPSAVGPSLAPHIPAQVQLTPELAEGTVLCVKGPAEVVTRDLEDRAREECFPPTLPPPLTSKGESRKGRERKVN